MLQRIAAEGGKGGGLKKTDFAARASSDDAWHTAKTLLGTITKLELLDSTLSPEDIVFRLFNSMSPHSAPARSVTDKCRCNVEKVESMLKQLSREEVQDLADEDGKLTITCEFCKSARTYDKDLIPLY